MTSKQDGNRFTSRSDEELKKLTVGELKSHNAPSPSLSMTHVGLKLLNGKLTEFVQYWEIR